MTLYLYHPYYWIKLAKKFVQSFSCKDITKILQKMALQGWFEFLSWGVCVCVCVCVSCLVVSTSLRTHGLQPARLLCPRNSPDKNTGVGCHFLLQGIFLNQGSNPGLLALWADSLLSEPPGKPPLMVENSLIHKKTHYINGSSGS